MSSHIDTDRWSDKPGARALRYLEEKFSLSEADVLGQSQLIRLFSGPPESWCEADRLIIESAVLLTKSVRNSLKNLGLEVNGLNLSQITEMVRQNIGTDFEGVETFLEGFHPLEAADEAMEKLIPAARADALEEVELWFGHLTSGWTETECAMSDEELSRLFLARQGAHPRFLSTYFDSACMGLVDTELQYRVDRMAQQSAVRNWPAFVKRMKTRIIRALEQVQAGAERRFAQERCFLHSNGTEAFRRFREACMKPGQRVLATHEEYIEIIREMARGRIRVTRFGDLDELRQQLCTSPFDFLLVSEVGRMGTVYPLREIDEVRQLISPDTRLIVDACQSAGRWAHNLGSCHADAVILSTQKGSDLGKGMGVIALAADMPVQGLSDQAGSLPHEEIVRTAFALNPDGLTTLKPAQRAKAISQNARKFLQLISAVNDEIGDAILIHSPLDTDGEILGHAVELSVDGVPREKICGLARSYGVYIADSYVTPKNHESLRIAFHPYMNNDALKILGYVLLKACELLDQDE